MSFDKADLTRRMEGAYNSFTHELGGLRTGRASASLLDSVQVEAYGSMMPISQVGTVSAPEPRLLSVQVWDKEMVAAVEKAILNANLGLNPASDGQTVRVPMPDLTEERRKELVKVANSYAENARVSVRNIRRDGMDTLKKQEKEKEISEDESRGLSDEVQKLTDQFVKQIDDKLKEKEKDILTV